jgi:hypothetical protein
MFWGISILFPQCLYSFAFSPSVYKGSSFTAPLPAFVVVFALEHGHSNWGEMNLSGFLIHISFITSKLNTYSYIYWSFVFLPLKITYSIHVPIASLGCWFSGVEFFELSVDSEY